MVEAASKLCLRPPWTSTSADPRPLEMTVAVWSTLGPTFGGRSTCSGRVQHNTRLIDKQCDHKATKQVMDDHLMRQWHGNTLLANVLPVVLKPTNCYKPVTGSELHLAKGSVSTRKRPSLRDKSNTNARLKSIEGPWCGWLVLHAIMCALR